jgi:hypothetical protein
VDIIALGEGPKPVVHRGRKKPKLFASDSFGIVVYLNQGDGTWEKIVRSDSKRKIFGDALALADFNRDGWLDAALASSILNRRDLLLEGREDGAWEPVELPLVRPRALISSVTTADFDLDGALDLAFSYTANELGVWRSGIDLLYNRGEDGWERHTVKVRENRDGVTSMSAGDLDGDGTPDLVAVTEIGETWIFLGRGKSGFVWEEAAEIEVPTGGCRGYRVLAVDLDRDGKDEIVEEFAGEAHPLYARGVCPSEGALRAWKPVVKNSSKGAAVERVPASDEPEEAPLRR